MKNLFVKQLSDEMQAQIEQELMNVGIYGEDLENALDSRLSDLADTIDLTPYKGGN